MREQDKLRSEFAQRRHTFMGKLIIRAADAFQILTHHAERHLNQAESVGEDCGFPQ